jgi:alkanesulfonate monooxygenase SsuD/methylene tetrahydromethanopterin reductase-like flavin-dependent oxidoreductase (luciferase family)
MSSTAEFHLFLPQMRLSMDALVEKAKVAEASGFTGIALMDHLAPPLAEGHHYHDAMVTAGWVAASTRSLRVSHLVLCDSFRHPAILAKQAVTLDHASGGRFELGIGWGSVPAELERFGIGSTDARERVERLGETLQVVRALWSGEPVSFSGKYHRIVEAQQQPTPLGEIPIVIGGAGPRTLEVVADHATWWNCPIYAFDRFDELRPRTGSSRASIQHMVGFVPQSSRREEIESLTTRRFGHMGAGVVIGDGPEMVEHHRDLQDRGVERFYVWFSDFAEPSTLESFGTQVIAEL